MQRRNFIWFLGAIAAARSLSVAAQQAAKPVRIGYLAVDLATGDPSGREAFVQALRDLGYVDGSNLVIEYRDAHGKPERFPALAAELVALNVDVILAGGGTLGALAAKQATTSIPIVFPVVGNPEVEGLVASLARPAMSRGSLPSPPN